MEQFQDNEKLFRAVRPPKKSRFYWSKDGKRISSLAFKNRPGESYVSVVRQADRESEDCIKIIQSFLEGSVVSVTYSQCCDSQIKVIAKPTNDNKYHCGLINGEINAESSLLTDIQCQNLADMAVFEFKDFE